MPRVSFYTLGCKLNVAETNTLQGDFEGRDFQAVPFGEEADVTVVNTCTVTAEAERQCRQIIRRALRANPETFVVVTGCYAQLRPEEIAAIDGVDAVLGASEKFRLFDVVEAFSKREETQIAVSCIDDATHFGPAYSAGARTRAFLKVQDGCDYSCSFCTIPMARGRSRSQSVEATVAQAHDIAGAGFREIVLSGVNIGLYGQDLDGDTALLDLFRALDAVDGIERFRISSIEPNLLTDAIIDFVAGSRAFVPHFHIPLQSGDDAVLGAMRRRYRRRVYAERVEHLLRQMPDAGIGADVIVGFPAETPERFENTQAFLRDLPVSYLHVFTYSERPGTIAVEHLKKQGTAIPKAERSRRNRVLRMLSQKKQHAFYAAHRDRVRPVLWEEAGRGGLMHGYTDNYIRVQRPHDPAIAGTVEKVRLGEIGDDGTVVAENATFISLL